MAAKVKLPKRKKKVKKSGPNSNQAKSDTFFGIIRILKSSKSIDISAYGYATDDCTIGNVATCVDTCGSYLC